MELANCVRFVASSSMIRDVTDALSDYNSIWKEITENRLNEINATIKIQTNIQKSWTIPVYVKIERPSLLKYVTSFMNQFR